MTALERPRSDNFKIAVSILTVACFVGAAKVIGALKEVGLAARFGTDITLDAYALDFNLLTWPINVYFSAVSVVLVPVLVHLSAAPAKEREQFFREVLGMTALFSAAAGVLFGGVLLGLINSGVMGMAPDTARVAAGMCLPMAAIIPLGVIASMLSTRLMSGRRYINTFFEAAPSLVILVVLAVIPKAGAGPLIWSTVAGYVVYVALLLLVQPKPWRDLIPSLSFKSPHWSDVGRSSLLMLAGQIIFTLGGAATDQVLVSHLGHGANATLGYATRLLMLVNTLGATALARATLPVFSQARLRHPGEEIKLTVQWVKILFVASVACSVLAFFVAPLVVRILFRHGAFTEHDAEAVTTAFRFGLLQLPFYFTGIVIVQLLASRKRFGLFIISNGVSLAIKLATALVLLNLFGLKGLLISSALMQAGSTALLLLFLRREQALSLKVGEARLSTG